MKFLVLALCVCAASAASYGSAPFGAGGYKPYKGFQNAAAAPAVFAAKAVAAPAVFAAKAVATPAVFAAKAVATPAVVAADAVASVAAPVAAAAAYGADTTYQAAKQVFNNAYSSNEGEATIIRSESDVSEQGYKYAFETGNGINVEAVGAYKPIGDAGSVVSQGSYRYTSPDGTPVVVTYIADENGYQPQSDVLPVGPAIPEAILRSLAYIAAQTKAAANN